MNEWCSGKGWRLGLLLICLLWSRLGWTAEPRMEPNEQELAQTLVLLHEPIVMLTAKYGNLDGAARVRLAHERVQRMEPSDLMTPVAVTKGSRHGQESREFLVNGKRILVLLEGDLDEFDELTLDQAAERVLHRLDGVRIKYLELHSTPICSEPSAWRWWSA